LLGNDHVGVDIGDLHWRGNAGQGGKGLHERFRQLT